MRRDRLRVVVLCLLGVLVGTIGHVSTVGGLTYAYDATTITRVGVHPIATADASPIQLSGSREWSVPPSAEARDAFTTPDARSVATTNGPDFVAGPIGSQPPVPVSQSRMAAGFDEAGFPSTPTASPETSYTLPDGSKVRLMEPTVQAPRRASFTNANNGYINPFTGKPVQPPAPPGMSMKEWVRINTHVEQSP